MGFTKYIAGDIIGVGSYAKVKIAYAEKFKQSVALKIVDQNKAPVSFLKKFLPRELNVLSKIHHPNIIQFYECFSHGAKIVMVMELAKYGDLLELIKVEKRLGPNKANLIFKQIADGVEYLHFNKIVHRDLKCENILLAENLIVKIGDFGFSRFFDEDDMLHTACGSLAYSSPELLRGYLYAGPPCDIWSMGVILFTAVCGIMPFKENNLRSLVAKQESKSWDFPESRVLGEELTMLIEGMLEPDTDTRLSIQEVQESEWL
ncbi:hypothetical protein CAPTEDRAFT_111818, partial [Capitella teleta]|uniref:Protein kinase domain-containing protein n=1 Tax=Capitella teleta TaxID=283909 RepID=X1YV62_CAPTE